MRNTIVFVCMLVFFNTLSVFAKSESEEEIDSNEASEVINQHYNLIVANTKVGDFNIRKVVHNEIVEYHAHSLVEINFFGSLQFEYTLHCVYKNNELKFSDFMLYRNGKLASQTIVNQEGLNYQCKRDDELIILDGPIAKSAVQLYFSEPDEDDKMLSEKAGTIIGIDGLGNNKYMLVVPENDRDISYNYFSGELKSVNVNLFITEFKMVRD